MANCPYLITYQIYLQSLIYFLQLHPWQRMVPFLRLSYKTNPKHAPLLYFLYMVHTLNGGLGEDSKLSPLP